MVKTYRCDICDYNVNMKSSYKKHLTTKKHLSKNPKILSINKSIIIDDNDITIFKCYYCKKSFKNNNYKYKHIKKCSEKHGDKLGLTETNNNELLVQTDQYVNKLQPISDEYITSIIEKCLETLMQKPDNISNTNNKINPTTQIVNITNNITNNNANTNNNNSNCINFNYIKKHYKNPKTIEECLASPLTEIEKFNITKATPIVGCEYLIKNRCITNVELEDRPMHSIDESRDKFAVYTENENNTKNWVTQNGSDITKRFITLIREEYEKQYNNPLCDHAKIAEGISYMYMDGNKKIIKSIAKMTNLKNNLANAKKKVNNNSDVINTEKLDLDKEVDYGDLKHKYTFIDNDLE
jgi:hypothetical protein